jgi:hypothetical protein
MSNIRFKNLAPKAFLEFSVRETASRVDLLLQSYKAKLILYYQCKIVT